MLIEATAKTITENVIDQLLSLIRSGAWKAGDEMPSERELMLRLGVGRSCVREALQSVASLGFIELRAGRRAKVKEFSASQLFDPAQMAGLLGAEDLIHLWQVRVALEVAAMRLAADRMDAARLAQLGRILDDLSDHMERSDLPAFIESDLAFHQCMIQATGNPIFVEVYNVITRAIRASVSITGSIPGGMQRGVRVHRALFDVLKTQDPVAAEAAMRAHLGDPERFREAYSRFGSRPSGNAGGSALGTSSGPTDRASNGDRSQEVGPSSSKEMRRRARGNSA
jgi:DNA-binding FadR family transcriptional regulator